MPNPPPPVPPTLEQRLARLESSNAVLRRLLAVALPLAVISAGVLFLNAMVAHDAQQMKKPFTQATMRAHRIQLVDGSDRVVAELRGLQRGSETGLAFYGDSSEPIAFLSGSTIGKFEVLDSSNNRSVVIGGGRIDLVARRAQVASLLAGPDGGELKLSDYLNNILVEAKNLEDDGGTLLRVVRQPGGASVVNLTTPPAGGVVGVGTSEKFLTATLGAGKDGGHMVIAHPNGNAVAQITATPAGAVLGLGAADHKERAQLRADATGAMLALSNAQQTRCAMLTSDADGAAMMFNQGRTGKPGVVVVSETKGRITVHNRDGTRVTDLNVSAAGDADVRFGNSQDKLVASMSASPAGGSFNVYRDATRIGSLGANALGGELTVFNPAGQRTSWIAVTPGGGEFMNFNRAGKVVTAIGANASGDADIAVNDRDQKKIIQLTRPTNRTAGIIRVTDAATGQITWNTP